MALKNSTDAGKLFDLFLSTIIIYKTVKFKEEKYLEILITLIENNQIIEKMNYGLEEKVIKNFQEQYDRDSEEMSD